jgi:hypothetical protein
MFSKFIYFIRPVGQRGPIKIGCSHLPLERLRAFSQWSPIPLEVVATCDGQHHGVERRLHLMFQTAHSHGEWFHPLPDLEAFVARVAAGEQIDDIIGPTPFPGPKRRKLTILSTASLQRLMPPSAA